MKLTISRVHYYKYADLGTTSLCLNTRLRVNKNFEFLINFIEINVNI